MRALQPYKIKCTRIHRNICSQETRAEARARDGAATPGSTTNHAVRTSSCRCRAAAGPKWPTGRHNSAVLRGPKSSTQRFLAASRTCAPTRAETRCRPRGSGHQSADGPVSGHPAGCPLLSASWAGVGHSWPAEMNADVAQ